MTPTLAAVWTVDGAGWLLTPSGAKAARVVDGAIMLYDKRDKCERPFTLADWFTVTQTQIETEGAMSHESKNTPDRPGNALRTVHYHG